MKLLAADPGSVRVGLAISHAGMALPRPAVSAERAAAEIASLANLEEVEAIIIGLPITLAGEHGSAAQKAIALAVETRQLIELPIWLLDERLTTNSARAKLRAAGKSSREQRSVIDSQAACELLEFALERSARGATLGKNLDEL